MFALHYTTRRFFCRVGFVLLCLAPTTGVLVWAGWLSTSGHVEACRRELETQLSVAARLAAVSHPQPEVAIYEGLELLDSRSRERLLYIPRLEIATRGEQTVLIATGPEIEQRALARWQKFLDHAWRNNAGSITLVAGTLTVHEPNQQHKLKEVRLHAAQTTAGNELTCTFREVAVDAPQPTRLRVRLDPESSTISLIDLDTGGGMVSCALAAPVVSELAHLGDRAGFQGTVTMEHDASGWQGNVEGMLSQIDLSRAITGNFPHRVEGPAYVRLQRLRLAHSRLAEAIGSVTGGPGLIGLSLRLAAADSLDLTPTPLAMQSMGLLEYDQLAFEFTLDAGGLSLVGRCSNAAPGALLINRDQMLLGQPRNQQPLPLTALIRMLSPSSPLNVPATHQATWLLEVLPLE